MSRFIAFTLACAMWTAAGLFSVLSMSNSTNSISVSSASQLMSALANAKGGETIILEAGNYGALSLYDKRETFAKFSDVVTIKSADGENMATFSSLYLRGAKNLVLDTVKFDYVSESGALENVRPFQILGGSSNIAIVNSVFDGDLAHGREANVNGYGIGIGLSVTDASRISVDNNEFYNWHRAAVFSVVEGLSVTKNDVHSIRSDGFNFADVDFVRIEGNYLHDFVGAQGTTDHRDMIQFWTNGTTSPSTDVVIRGNVLDSGGGDWTQSIFMRNEEVDTGRQGDAMFYRNIVIEDNVIYNAHTHGITVGETHGLIIRNNTILHNKATGGDAAVYVPTIDIKPASTEVTVANNIVPRLILQPTVNAIVENNLVVQRELPSGQNYYGNLFVNALADGSATPSDLMALPGGPIEQLGVGSSLTRFPTKPETLMGFISEEPGSGVAVHTLTFGTPNVFGPSGKIDMSGASVVWDFGDGTAAKGLSATHAFGRAGTYDVEATVTLADGNVFVINKIVRVDTPLALSADFNKSVQDLSGVENAAIVSPLVTFEEGQQGQAARLNGGKITFARNSELFNNSEYTLLLNFKKDADSEESGGRLVYFSGSFVVTLSADGVQAAVTTDKGNGTIKADKIGIRDADWHQLALTFSGKHGAAVLYIDGVEVGRLTGLEGHIQKGSTSHDLHIGDMSEKASFSGLVDNFAFVRGALTSEQVTSYYQAPWDFHPPNVSPTEDPAPLPPASDPLPPASNRGDLDLGHYSRVLAADFEVDARDFSRIENAATVAKTVTFEECELGQATRLNGGTIAYVGSPELYNNSQYTLLFDFRKDKGAEDLGGRIISFSYSFVLFLGDDGISASVTTDKGGGWIKTNGVGIKDSEWHQIALTFSGEDGAAILYVDGNEVGRLEGLDGHIQKGHTSHSLYVGDPFGKQNFSGLVDNLVFLQGAMTAEEVQANYETPYDFCQQETTFAAIAESSLQATSFDVSGSSATFVAPADTTSKTAAISESSTPIKTASTSGAGTTSGSTTPVVMPTATTGDILLTSYSSAQEGKQTDSFVFTASHSSDGDASDELLTWSPDESETMAVASDFGLAEELTQVHDAHTPDLLLG